MNLAGIIDSYGEESYGSWVLTNQKSWGLKFGGLTAAGALNNIQNHLDVDPKDSKDREFSGVASELAGVQC